MPRALSVDLRLRVLNAYENGEGTYAALADRFAINVSSVNRILSRARSTGSVAPKSQGGRRSFKFGEEEREILKGWLIEDPDVTLADLQRRLREEHGLTVHLSNVHRQVISLGFSRKKRRSPMQNGRPLV